MNSRIQQLSDHVVSKLGGLIAEAEGDILTAIDAVVQNANDEEKEPILTVPISVKWNMDTNNIEVSVRVSVKHKFTSEASLEDPKQGKLDVVEEHAKSMGRMFKRAGANKFEMEAGGAA